MMNKLTTWFSIIILLPLLFSCQRGSDNTFSGEDKIRFKQYRVEGKRLYLEHCSNCHQDDGTGLARLYPPLKDSDFFKKDPGLIACIIKNGQEGELLVNGISYNQPMPANPRLTNLEIAEIMTYIYSTWGEQNRFFKHGDINDFLNECDSLSPEKTR